MAASSPSASSSGSQGPPTPPPVERPPPSALVESLSAFAQHLRTNEHVLATEDGDEVLAGEALGATKRIFDIALSLESSSHPHIHRLITQLTDPSSLPSTTPTTRPTTRQSRKKSLGLPQPTTILPLTPLDSLYTENGLPVQAVWDQMEMRTGRVGDVLKVLEIGSTGPVDDDEEAGQAAGQAFDEDDDEDEEEDEEEEEDDLTPEEKEQWEALLREKPEMFSEWESDDEEDEEAGESDEDEDEESDGMEVDEDDEEDDEDDEEEDEDDELDDEEEDDLMEGLDDEEDEDEDDEEDDPTSSRSKPNHPTLDDQFFSIDAFNRFTEETEATSTSSGSLGGKKKKGKAGKGKGKRKGLLGEEDEEEDDDDEDEEDDLGLDSEVGDLFGGDILAAAGDAGDNMMYADFFPPPREWTREKPVKGKGKADSKDKPKKTKRKVDSAPEASAEAAVDGRDIMTRVRTDLFADDDEADEDEPAERLSTHEKRLRALQEQISSFEQENVGKKEWTLLGEVKARERPQNSMLEEDLEFEQMGKVVPIVTEDKVVGLEDMIKRRILDENFDDVVRRRELDDKAFIPSRYFELENSASSKSLAQIYEDDYKNASGDGKVEDARDAKLNKDHEEIETLWGEICYKLDALSNLNFTPKQPKAAITTLSNVATTSMENAFPTTQSTSTMLAPEEMFAPASKSDLVARSELDPLQKKRMRQKDRKTRMRQRQALDSAVDKFAGKSGGGGKARGGVKSQKDRALKELVKTGKGVTVVGKDSVKKPRRNDRENVSQSATLKL